MKVAFANMKISVPLSLLIIGFVITSFAITLETVLSEPASTSDTVGTSTATDLPAAIGTPAPTSTPAPYTLIYSAEPGPDVETLQQIASGATTSAEILEDVVNYYKANRERLGVLWREENETRLAALFSMYVVHISTAYGVAAWPTSMLDYINEPRAQCGTYTYAEAHLVGALGLTWRVIEFVGEHAWVEVQVDGHWEVFDGTTNTWINKGVEALMRGEIRQYRQFYTPLLDINRPDARLHMAEGYDMQRLRQRMPTIGVIYMPPGQLNIGTANTGIPKN